MVDYQTTTSDRNTSLKKRDVVTLLGMVGGAALTWRLMELDREARKEQQLANSEQIETSEGSIEVSYKGQGQPVLVIHGAMGSYEHATNFSGPLADCGFQIVAPSRPGHLGTSLSEQHTAHQQADLIAAMLRKLDIHQIPVVAISGGGPVGMALAANHPELCQSLTLINAITHKLDPFRLAVIRSANRLVQWLPAQDYLAWLVTRFIVQTLPIWSLLKPEFRRLVIRDSNNLDLYKDAVRRFFPVQDLLSGFDNDMKIYGEADIAVAKDIQVPVLIVHSKTAITVPHTHALKAEHHIKDNDTLYLTDAGHAMHLTHAGEIWEKVASFIRENEAVNS
jgi:pimeloyl-ACP methyl ester carboxylesterase